MLEKLFKRVVLVNVQRNVQMIQVNEQVEQVIEALKEQLRVKDQQIEEKDRQIQGLHEILSRQQQLAAIQEQRIIQLTAAEPEEDQPAGQEKKGLFRRLLAALTAD